MAGLKTEDILRYLEANHQDTFRAAIEYARNFVESPNSPEAGPSAEVEPSDAEVAPSKHPAKASEGTRVPRASRVPRSPKLSGNEMEEDGSSSFSDTDETFR